MVLAAPATASKAAVPAKPRPNARAASTTLSMMAAARIGTPSRRPISTALTVAASNAPTPHAPFRYPAQACERCSTPIARMTISRSSAPDTMASAVSRASIRRSRGRWTESRIPLRQAGQHRGTALLRGGRQRGHPEPGDQDQGAHGQTRTHGEYARHAGQGDQNPGQQPGHDQAGRLQPAHHHVGRRELIGGHGC